MHEQGTSYTSGYKVKQICDENKENSRETASLILRKLELMPASDKRVILVMAA